MSLPVWPASLPYRPTADGFGVGETQVPPYTTELEGGAYRQRRRSTLRRALFSMKWQFKPADRDQFRTFYHQTLFDGELRFRMMVPDGPAGGYVERTCQFKGMYREAAPNAVLWDISAELYVFGNI